MDRRARTSKARDRRDFYFLANVRNIPAVVQPLSSCQWFRLLTVCFQCFKHNPIVSFSAVRATHNSFALIIGQRVKHLGMRKMKRMMTTTMLKTASFVNASTSLCNVKSSNLNTC